ncbi:MAG TPA: glutamate-1-semialdehyde 2,1-aminomutase [bacterium]|nr:glutamate-1-semialdehyde 2,1-aminomutase [bacterium]HQO35273.1 glutamate-1-semialdehyde 2,1-aminomutase [bacterium]HQP99597.1 glutamate-1-semialdehyde 2,1-aminomutase [bacterium]
MKNSSVEIHLRAQKVIPGGVNSPVRAGKAVGRSVPVIASGKGCYVTDVDGNQYIDFVGSWGPLILGHAHKQVVEAVQKTVKSGLSFGLPTERELELAEMIVSMVPSIEMVRLVNSGTEATMSAVRLARAFTGRNKILICAGGYHGNMDALLASSGSGMATLSIPSTPGIPPSVVEDTIVVPYNNIEAVKRAYAEHKGQIAAHVIEPVAGNMGVVPPQERYLSALRELSRKEGTLLIFDEVMTGFRVALGGAQQRYGVQPDLTTLGKIVGGGMPVGAYGGRAEIMSRIAPSGDVYQAGTLSGNPLATAAGIATLSLLKTPKLYDDLEEKSSTFAEGIAAAAKEARLPMTCNRVGSMMTFFFTDTPVTDFESAKTSNTALFGAFWRLMYKEGILLPPSQFEAVFVSTAHTLPVLQRVVRIAEDIFAKLAETPESQLNELGKETN